MAKIIVYHDSFGCETGCCGHTVAFDDATKTKFEFTHPYYAETPEERLAWAKDLVRDTFGEEHVADLDWENSWVSDD